MAKNFFLFDEIVKNFLTKIKEKEGQFDNYEEVNLKPGYLVKITEGEFINQEGRITQVYKKDQEVKVKIFVESSGWEISDVPANICEKVVG